MKFIQKNLLNKRIEITFYQSPLNKEDGGRIEIGITIEWTMIPTLFCINLIFWSIEIGYYTKEQYKEQLRIDKQYEEEQLEKMSTFN